jgi:hypothetical protein
MNKHTAGPWKVSDGAVLSDKLNAYGNWIVVSCERERTEEDEANLKLIAASPDMLAALKEAVKTLEATCKARKPEANGGLGLANPDEIVTLHIARAAIAKAEGRE